MKRSLFDIKIPTLFGLVLLLMTVLATVYFTQSNTFVNLRANSSVTPTFVRISNIKENSFTISFTTATATTGIISYCETVNVGQVVIDDKDNKIYLEYEDILTLLKLF